MTEELQTIQNIQNQLTQRLEAYNLVDKISFDETALEELHRISNGEWQHAELYAGTAILDALQNQRPTVSKANIEAVDIAEAMTLMLSGKDIWDNIKYIGQVPDMTKCIQTRRMLHLFDADRDIDAMDSVREKRLPKYALNNLVQYDEKGILGPEVKIPFKHNLSREEVKAVAENVAIFVAQHTGEAQELRDISQNHPFLTQYLIQPKTETGKDPLLNFPNFPNYCVANSFGFDSKKAGGVVIVRQERSCKHNETTLEAYVRYIKPQVHPK